MNYGEPSSYLALEKGCEVVSSDGEHIGKVERVVAEPGADIFEGIVIHTRLGPGGHVFATADQVGEIYEKAVVLGLSEAEAESLPEPS